MPERKAELRAAAAKRSRDRRSIITPQRECEGCGAAVQKAHPSHDPVQCWECLKLLNGNQRAGRPQISVQRGGDAA